MLVFKGICECYGLSIVPATRKEKRNNCYSWNIDTTDDTVSMECLWNKHVSVCICLLMSIKLDQTASRRSFKVGERVWDPCKCIGWTEELYWYLMDLNVCVLVTVESGGMWVLERPLILTGQRGGKWIVCLYFCFMWVICIGGVEGSTLSLSVSMSCVCLQDVCLALLLAEPANGIEGAEALIGLLWRHLGSSLGTGGATKPQSCLGWSLLASLHKHWDYANKIIRRE